LAEHSLIAVPSAVLVGLETYHATAVLPDLARSQAAVVHTFQVIDTARALDEAIQDAERGERGFIITGKTEYLEPYSTGIKETPDKLAQLKKLSEDNPEQQRRLQLLNEQINAKLSELKRVLDAHQSGGFDAAGQNRMRSSIPLSSGEKPPQPERERREIIGKDNDLAQLSGPQCAPLRSLSERIRWRGCLCSMRIARPVFEAFVQQSRRF